MSYATITRSLLPSRKVSKLEFYRKQNWSQALINHRLFDVIVEFVSCPIRFLLVCSRNQSKRRSNFESSGSIRNMYLNSYMTPFNVISPVQQKKPRCTPTLYSYGHSMRTCYTPTSIIILQGARRGRCQRLLRFHCSRTRRRGSLSHFQCFFEFSMSFVTAASSASLIIMCLVSCQQ